MILNIGESSKALTCLNAYLFPHFPPFTCILLSMNYKRSIASRSVNCFCISFLKARFSKQPSDQHILISMKWTATIPKFHGIRQKCCWKTKSECQKTQKISSSALQWPAITNFPQELIAVQITITWKNKSWLNCDLQFEIRLGMRGEINT